MAILEASSLAKYILFVIEAPEILHFVTRSLVRTEKKNMEAIARKLNQCLFICHHLWISDYWSVKIHLQLSWWALGSCDGHLKDRITIQSTEEIME